MPVCTNRCVLSGQNRCVFCSRQGMGCNVACLVSPTVSKYTQSHIHGKLWWKIREHLIPQRWDWITVDIRVLPRLIIYSPHFVFSLIFKTITRGEETHQRWECDKAGLENRSFPQVTHLLHYKGVSKLKYWTDPCTILVQEKPSSEKRTSEILAFWRSPGLVTSEIRGKHEHLGFRNVLLPLKVNIKVRTHNGRAACDYSTWGLPVNLWTPD